MERTYLVEAMKCGGCAKNIENLLSQVAGVQAVTTDLASKSVTVTGQVDQASLQAALAQTKYVLAAKYLGEEGRLALWGWSFFLGFGGRS